MAKHLSEITVQNRDELFLWKAIVIFILILMASSIFYFIRLSYQKTNALIDQTSETVVSKSGFSIENIDLDAFAKAAALIDYKRNPLTLPFKMRNIFFYDGFEITSYKPPRPALSASSTATDIVATPEQ